MSRLEALLQNVEPQQLAHVLSNFCNEYDIPVTALCDRIIHSKETPILTLNSDLVRYIASFLSDIGDLPRFVLVCKRFYALRALLTRDWQQRKKKLLSINCSAEEARCRCTSLRRMTEEDALKVSHLYYNNGACIDEAKETCTIHEVSHLLPNLTHLTIISCGDGDFTCMTRLRMLSLTPSTMFPELKLPVNLRVLELDANNITQNNVDSYRTVDCITKFAIQELHLSTIVFERLRPRLDGSVLAKSLEELYLCGLVAYSSTVHKLLPINLTCFEKLQSFHIQYADGYNRLINEFVVNASLRRCEIMECMDLDQIKTFFKHVHALDLVRFYPVTHGYLVDKWMIFMQNLHDRGFKRIEMISGKTRVVHPPVRTPRNRILSRHMVNYTDHSRPCDIDQVVYPY